MKVQKKTFRFFRIILRMWKALRDYFASALEVDEDRKILLYIDLAKSSTLKDLMYWLQIFFSAGIATLGLILNSPAVIIGAMLISPLMGPILSAGLALATGDLILAVRSFVNLLISSLGAIALAVVLVAFLPFKEATSEILARTSPNTLDLGVALFSGAVGSVAICKEVKGVVTSIPGVAIAVALMPPLCVVGYGVGLAVSVSFTDGLTIAAGGGLLYLTNLVAITFTAMVVFIMLRIDTPKVREKVRAWRDADMESEWWHHAIARIPWLEHAREIRSMSLRLLMIVLPLLLIFIPLTNSYYQLKDEIQLKRAQNEIRRTARAVWNEKFSTQQNGESRTLDELRVNTVEDKLEIYLRVFDNQPYTQEERADFHRELAKTLNRREDSLNIQIIEIPTSARELAKPKTDETPIQMPLAELQSQFLQRIQNSLNGVVFPPPAKLLDFKVSKSPNSNIGIELFYLSERDIDVDARALLAENIKQRLNFPNASIVFARIPIESKTFNFVNNQAVLSDDVKESFDETVRKLQTHPRLKLEFNLNSKINGELQEQRQIEIKNYFVQKGSIAEDRITFIKSDEENNLDSFKIALNE